MQGGAVPDFEREEAAIGAYESAKLRYIRAITQDAEVKLREAFGKRREAINDEIANLRSVAKLRSEAATVAAQKYAAKLPHRVRKTGVRPPSFWERLVTLNAVARSYRTAAAAAEEFDEINELLRKRRDRLDAMERETRRSIYLREEAVRKKLQTPEGLAAMHADPMVKAAFAKMQDVENERAKYDERVKRGEVPPEEARDREMAQRGMTFAAVPLEGVMISRIARYGAVEFYVLRDLSNHEYLLSCDPALEPLRDCVFDVARSSAGYEAALRHTAEGVPMRVLDHLKAGFSSNDATDLYARHRAALRTDRATQKTIPRDENEAEMIAMLGLLAEAVLKRVAPPAAAEAGAAYSSK
ncbi:MAG TPA: hypothetical protein VIJ64_08425 [Candidatus Lustribacter sp.]